MTAGPLVLYLEASRKALPKRKGNSVNMDAFELDHLPQ